MSQIPKIDMDAAMDAIQNGSITMAEFNRLNCLHVLGTRGHEIFAPESIEHLARLLTPFNPWKDTPWLAPVPIHGIMLRKEGDHTIVDVEMSRGQKMQAIRDLSDNSFSHEITAEGIRDSWFKNEDREEKEVSP